MNAVRVVITVDLDRFDEAAQAAQNAGLTIEHRLDNVGMLVGTIPTAKLPTLRDTSLMRYGILDVSPRVLELDLPDPD